MIFFAGRSRRLREVYLPRPRLPLLSLLSFSILFFANLRQHHDNSAVITNDTMVSSSCAFLSTPTPVPSSFLALRASTHITSTSPTNISPGPQEQLQPQTSLRRHQACHEPSLHPPRREKQFPMPLLRVQGQGALPRQQTECHRQPQVQQLRRDLGM